MFIAIMQEAGAAILSWDTATKLAAIFAIAVPIGTATFTVAYYLVKLCQRVIGFFERMEEKLDRVADANEKLCDALGMTMTRERQ